MKIKIVIGLITLFLITMMQQTSAAIPASERNALITLYNSTNGDNWVDNTGWLGSPGTECSWEGVTCNGNSITEITLRFNRLTGSIPPELGQLSQLTYLSLLFNQLTGSIPPELGQLSQLTKLILSSNQLTGSIPPELGQLSQLTKLILHSNQLTGSPPSELGQIPNLISLSLERNQLTDSIPDLIEYLGIPPKLVYVPIPPPLTVASFATIHGTVIDSCTQLSIEGVIIENSSTKQSTKSFGEKGKFGMSIYPGEDNLITISHNGYKTQEDIINTGEDCRGCSGKHVDLGTIQLVPIEGCNNPPINIFTPDNIVGFILGPDFFSDIEHIEIESLKQQAIAVYDDVTGILTIKEVKVGNDIFEAILKENQYSIFTLVSAVPLSKGLSSNPAIFNFDTKLAEIPDVFYLNQLYSMQLRQLPSGNTFIIQNKILLP